MKQVSLIAFTGLLLAAVTDRSRAAERPAVAAKDSTPGVIAVLKQESSGEVASRREPLIDILRRNPHDAAARWQAGQVKLGVLRPGRGS